MIAQVHLPALWEGGCDECTDLYRADPVPFLDQAGGWSYPLRTIDWRLHDMFALIHEDHEA